jgi:hypothetical protein
MENGFEWPGLLSALVLARSMPTRTTRSIRSSSQSISSLAKSARLRIPPELADPVGPLDDAHAGRGRAGLVVRLLRGLTIGAVVQGNNPR